MPVTNEIANRLGVSILEMPLKMIFAREVLIAANMRAGKWSFLGVTSHVCFQTTGPVEALSTPVDLANITPCTPSFTFCPFGSTLRIIHGVIA